LLRSLPGGVATLAVGAFVLLLFCVPVLDQGPSQSPAKKMLRGVLGILIIAAWVVLGVKGYLE
jgi:quinol-cytochrome oxidoreductase complex cytochrome b subunit